ncbi:ethanolamine ammonia-lyase subunit EutB [Aurantimonas endophytica]|uniref:Ethanolamine ammonia-lyase large subunit n=1 Tax=Aurantimonas endophytica TaxID=1522175 RepID=A0A7W6MPI6_9HYPH|nr:ethanolamine ammonia-lyase subunit EutB [Aurantimonas endophytica]MBB4002927.1 ethanolamine ammonia-lyase large subunit [Aurantimonas endophytica]MCO6403804.1 ethanolamine ammonia-lyase subunit EutB [Aurantimonas endophytica]
MSGEDLKNLLAKASPARSGDFLAGIAAASRQERVKAQRLLADTTLGAILESPLIDPEADDVSALILRQHDSEAFRPIAGWSVGEMREWLLSEAATPPAIAALKWALTPEMVAAVAKICRNQDLIAIARKRPVVTAFRTTVGLPGRLSVRIQPNHPTDDPRGVAASIVDGLAFGCGDAVIGINPATDSPSAMRRLLDLIEELRLRLGCPVQSCVLAHVTTAIDAMNRAAPVDLVFQSVAGSQKANASFGISIAMLKEAHEAARGLKRGTVGDNVMYFETGQGSALSADAHHGIDQQTMEARAYAVAREFDPLLVNTVVGFIGPEYLYDGKEIIRAGLEDHFCGKLLGVPMGVDVCYTNHAEADQDDMDNLLTLLAVAGVNFVMGVPGSDDVMLNYQSTSYHDAAYVRRALGLRPSPEFEAWLADAGIFDQNGFLKPSDGSLMLAARAHLLEAAE